MSGSAADPWSPLESAVHNNRVALARLLIERGANVNAIGNTGYTPLLFVASIDFGDTEMMKLLLKVEHASISRIAPERRHSTSRASTTTYAS